MKVDFPRKADDLPAAQAGVSPEGPGQEHGDWDGPLVLSFDSHPRPFLVRTFHCDNPDCNCNEMSMVFIEVREKGSGPGNSIQFPVRLNLDTWEESTNTERTPQDRRLVEEFLNDLTEDLKQRLREEYEAGRDHARRAAAYSASADDILDGLLISHTEVFDDQGSILFKGHCAGFEVDLDGTGYIIEDLYCANPSCHCNTVHLVFLRKEKEGLAEHFSAKLSFRGGVSGIQTEWGTKAEAKRVVSMWREQEPSDLLAELRSRYDEIQRIGERILAEEETRLPQPRSSGGKTGRNDPCPCGSGRKYKKCCGLSP